ncbi:MAG: hypothetical protein ABSF77_08630 [Spirochaetia bacterium]|jgi:hypothetical protein
MEGSADYQDQLDLALDKRREWLETTQIPRLREALASFVALFEGVVAMLIRKGLLREDPYNYEQVFTEIVIPSDETLPEFENSDEVSYRLAAYRRQLKYVSTEYPLELQSLGLGRLKKVSSLLAYINWLELGESSKSPTTRGFARAFMKVRMGADTMASQILKDSEIQIVRLTHQIRAQLAELIAYHRESWKAAIRRDILPGISMSAAEPRARKEEMQRALRRGFANKMANTPWYPALTEEITDEELASDGAQRKQKILASLALPEPPKAETTAAPDGRAILLEAVRLFSRPHEELATALAVLEENERIILGSRGGGSGWFRRLLGVGASQPAGDRVYKLQYAEPGTPPPKTETLDFSAFSAEVKKKASLLATLASGTSAGFRKLASTKEEEIAGFIDKQLNELLLIHRRLGSLNTMFQARVMQEKKTTRGIKIELLTIKNSIIKANQRRHEYKEKGAG